MWPFSARHHGPCGPVIWPVPSMAHVAAHVARLRPVAHGPWLARLSARPWPMCPSLARPMAHVARLSARPMAHVARLSSGPPWPSGPCRPRLSCGPVSRPTRPAPCGPWAPSLHGPTVPIARPMAHVARGPSLMWPAHVARPMAPMWPPSHRPVPMPACGRVSSAPTMSGGPCRGPARSTLAPAPLAPASSFFY
nr:basic proline-rich protein-like [Penaeus vannamei]